MSKPLISLVIPAHNEEAEIKICLDSLLKQELPKKYFEVIVVDNASTDRTATIIKRYPFKYIFEPKRSVVVARQTGVNSATGEIIVSADADTRYPKDWLKTIKNDFDNNPGIIGIVGWIYYRKAPKLFNMTNALSQEINLYLSKKHKKFPVVFAANFAFKKSALKKIGGYPSHLPELGDQQYLLRKFQKIGRVIVDPKVKCYTSGRHLKKAAKNIIVYNGWHRLIGYPINLFLEKEIIGAKPAIRRKTISGKLGKHMSRGH